VKEGVL
jgi:Ca2+-binding EF-hand superfamily protein